MALSEDHNFTLHFDFEGHIFIFEAEITYKIEFFKAENNFQTTSKQLQYNFQKAQNTDVLSPIIVKMILIHIWLLRSKIIPNQFLNNSKPNFKKSKKTLFGSKMINSRVTILAKVSNCLCFLDLRA